MRDLFSKKKPDMNGEKPILKSKGPQEMVDADKVDTVVGAGSIVKGDMHSRGTLRVDGNVEGNISAEASVIIGAKGDVKANIIAGRVIVGGTVHGNVTARDKVEILSTGRLYGDVTTAAAKFVVAEGVIFEGRCSMSKTDTTKDHPPKIQPGAEEKQEVGAASKHGAA
ncbi:MAG: polymer-forming cytoskeletal protein [Candidatus Hydrogenedentota bacterium]|nr:MAG: polymer-forming cytoskeletal protein [Candidatus Hydrogenedentota bacterium]